MVKYATLFLPTALTLLFLAACDSGTSTPTPASTTEPTPQSTNTPQRAATGTPSSSIKGPTTPPVIGTKEATPLPTGTASIANAGMLLSSLPSGATSLAWSPDGKLLAAAMGGFGGSDHGAVTNDIWVWQADGTLVGTWKGHSAGVMALAWTPDGETLASGSADGVVKLWGKDGSTQATMRTGVGIIFSLSWTPDSRKLAAGGLKSTTDNGVQIWTRDGTPDKTLHTKYSGGKFYNSSWSPDGKFLVAGATDYSLWDATGVEITSTVACAQCTPAWGFAWSPDSKLWTTGNESGYVAIYDMAGNLVKDFQAYTGVSAMAWSPDSTILAAANGLWKADGTQISSLRGFRSTVTSLSWSPDGKVVAAGASGISNTGLVGIFDTEGVEIYRAENPGGQVNRVAWSPDGKLLAVAYENKSVRLLSVEGGTAK